MGHRRLILRAGLLFLLLFGLLTIMGGSASAVDLNPLHGIEDKLCPSKNAPTPEMPDNGLPPGTGDYATYGYAGLTWTTFDQSCLSTAKLDNGIGNSINDLATGVDGLVNQAQADALDPHFTDPLRRVTDLAVPQLRQAFFDPWLKAGLGGAALVLVLAWAFGRETEGFRTLLNVFLVLGVVFFILASPGRISQMSADMTTGVASNTGQALAGATGAKVDNPATSFTDAYYSLSYRAWSDGAFCYNQTAADRWGPRIRDNQAYTVDEKRRIEADPAAAAGIKDAKQKAWLATAAEMKKTDPAAYDCWSGTTSSRFKSGMRHLIASVMAGVWVLLCALGLLILQDMLLLGILLVVGVGAVLIALRKAADRMFEFILLAAVGAPFVALVMGILLTGYFVIMSDPGTSWLSATILSVSLGAAVFFSRPFLRRLFLGLSAVDQGHKVSRKITRTATATAAAAGAAYSGGTSAGGSVARKLGSKEASGDDRRPVPQGGAGENGRDGADGKPGPDRASSNGDGSSVPVPVGGDSRRSANGSSPDGVELPNHQQQGADVHDDDLQWLSEDQDHEREFPVPATPDSDRQGDGRPPARTEDEPRQRRLALTEDEERSWRQMASAQLEAFGHAPLSGPSPHDVYEPPPVSGDDLRADRER